MKNVIALLSIAIISNCQDIAFPENPRNPDSALDQVPIYAPDKCPGNQLFYPGEQKDDLSCDCGYGFIYYPPKDACFNPYKQGPCSKGYHLIYNKNKRISECVPNPCKEGYARYKGKCYEMGKPNGPCPPIEAGGGIFDVNATTLVVECLNGTNRLTVFKIPPRCAPGSRADIMSQCQAQWRR